MDERPVGRDITSRNRLARLFALGNRNNPKSWTPGLILSKQDKELPISIAPFEFFRRGENFPAELQISTRDKLCFPFESSDTWRSSEGLVLPPSLYESDSGEFGKGKECLPISWNSLHNDNHLDSLEYDPSIIILVDSPQLANIPELLVKAIFTIRTRFPSSLLWTPGIGGPDNCALLSWFGVDLFDLSRSRRASYSNILLTELGPRYPDITTNEKSDLEIQYHHWIKSISATRSAIQNKSLRELAERQSTSSAKSVEHLRRHDSLINNNENIFLFSSAVSKNRKLNCHTFESRNDPLISSWRDRIENNYTPPKHQREILVLLPCSAKKPYSLSQSHKVFKKYLVSKFLNEVIVTSPLGLVPRELENLWPAAHYDIPVTGSWDEDEKIMIKSMIEKLVTRVGYKYIINHTDINISGLNSIIINSRDGRNARSEKSLEKLKTSCEECSTNLDFPSKKYSPRLNVIKSISRFLYSSDEWLDGLTIFGRPPILTIYSGKEQIAKWNPKTGRFSFSKKGIQILNDLGLLPTVHISPGIDWKGDIFSSIIESVDKRILIGDEVVVLQNNEIIGSARALAPGWEWAKVPGKLARARHRL